MGSSAAALPEFDAYLLLKGIKGESTAVGEEDRMEVLSFTWGISQSGGYHVVGDNEAQVRNATFDDFVFSKVVDSASSALYDHCARGKLIKFGLLEICHPIGQMRDGGRRISTAFQTIRFWDIAIVGVQLTGEVALTGAPRPVEQVTLRYGKVAWMYFPSDHKGATGLEYGAGWNLYSDGPWWPE